MKIKMIKDHDRRISPAVVQALKAGHEPNLPRKDAEKLISEGVAVAVEDASNAKEA